MSDPKSGVQPAVKKSGLHAIDTPHAPVIFFDGAPVFGVFDGAVRITLVAARSVPTGPKVTDDIVVVGYLRCGLRAAVDLRNNIDKAILLAAKPRGRSQ